MADNLKLGVIDNTGPNNLQAFLRTNLRKASSVDIAVAFVTATGLDAILYLLERVAAKGRVRLLTGLFQGVTEPEALRSLLRRQGQTKGRISVCISTDPHFHWKSYFILTRTKATAVVGSSNLTKDGLLTSGELNVVLSTPKRSKQFRDVHRVFEDEWNNRAKVLQAIHITEYQKDRGRALRPPVSINLRRILKDSAKGSAAASARKYWRDCVTGALSNRAESLLKETTDWDKKGHWYFSTRGTKYSIGDRIVLFDLEEEWLRMWEVVAVTKTPESTPDGRDFAACKSVPRVPRRRLNDAWWKKLKEAGLLAKRGIAKGTHVMSEERYNRFKAMLCGR